MCPSVSNVAMGMLTVCFVVADRRKRLIALKAEISSVQRELRTAIKDESRSVSRLTLLCYSGDRFWRCCSWCSCFMLGV